MFSTTPHFRLRRLLLVVLGVGLVSSGQSLAQDEARPNTPLGQVVEYYLSAFTQTRCDADCSAPRIHALHSSYHYFIEFDSKVAAQAARASQLDQYIRAFAGEYLGTTISIAPSSSPESADFVLRLIDGTDWPVERPVFPHCDGQLRIADNAIDGGRFDIVYAARIERFEHGTTTIFDDRDMVLLACSARSIMRMFDFPELRNLPSETGSAGQRLLRVYWSALWEGRKNPALSLATTRREFRAELTELGK